MNYTAQSRDYNAYQLLEVCLLLRNLISVILSLSVLSFSVISDLGMGNPINLL